MILEKIKLLHEKAWDCKFYDWKDYVGSWFMLSVFFIIPWMITGFGCLKDYGNHWGFLIWPVLCICAILLAKGMAENLGR